MAKPEDFSETTPFLYTSELTQPAQPMILEFFYLLLDIAEGMKHWATGCFIEKIYQIDTPGNHLPCKHSQASGVPTWLLLPYYRHFDVIWEETDRERCICIQMQALLHAHCVTWEESSHLFKPNFSPGMILLPSLSCWKVQTDDKCVLGSTLGHQF